MSYKPNPKRYTYNNFKRCGDSGLDLPQITLGLWHNFGGKVIKSESKKMIFRAFDRGVTHFDLANNYGPPYGSAESNFGNIISHELKKYRDEILVSTKAGYDMWPGPYGEWGSKKYITASLDQSLNRMKLDYVDIFYSHRFDPNTPLEETADALHRAVHQGKALYIGISSYSSKQTIKMNKLLKQTEISNYLGLDIVEGIIDENIKLYENKNIKFKSCDIVDYETAEPFDLVLMRDFFIHTNNEDIKRIFINIKKMNIKYFAFENYNISKNVDVIPGRHRKINLKLSDYH